MRVVAALVGPGLGVADRPFVVVLTDSFCGRLAALMFRAVLCVCSQCWGAVSTPLAIVFKEAHTSPRPPVARVYAGEGRVGITRWLGHGVDWTHGGGGGGVG